MTFKCIKGIHEHKIEDVEMQAEPVRHSTTTPTRTFQAAPAPPQEPAHSAAPGTIPLQHHPNIKPIQPPNTRADQEMLRNLLITHIHYYHVTTYAQPF
jgi:hypothetical protein